MLWQGAHRWAMLETAAETGMHVKWLPSLSQICATAWRKAQQVNEQALACKRALTRVNSQVLSMHAPARPGARPSGQACCGKHVQGQRVYLNAWRLHDLVGELALQQARSTPQMLMVGRERSVERLQHSRQRFLRWGAGGGGSKVHPCPQHLFCSSRVQGLGPPDAGWTTLTHSGCPHEP